LHPSWHASIDIWKGFGENLAQHVGDGDTAMKRCDLDPVAQFRRDVDRQPRGEGAVLRGRKRGCLRPLDPALDVAGMRATRSRTCAVACRSIAQPK
jgi:hypothetical protein